MKRAFIAGVLSCWFGLQAYAAVTITNLTVAQREGTKLVDLVFDANNTTGASVFVSVLVSNGTTSVSVPTLSGDFGGTVVGKGLHVVWNGGADLNNTASSNLSITVAVAKPLSGSMVHIPAGTNSGDDPDFSYDLTVGDFLMDDAEITGGDWQTVYNWAVAHGYRFSHMGAWKGSDYPVVLVDWFSCILWCNARSEMEGLVPAYVDLNGVVVRDYIPGRTINERVAAEGYRLPTDVEFEYAARGGLSDLRFPWGDTISHAEANYLATSDYDYDVNETSGLHPDYDDGSSNRSNPVDDFEPNEFDLYGMSGNVWEWCWSGNQRSGSWADDAFKARNGYSESADPTSRSTDVGFRTVRSLLMGARQTKTIAFDSRDYALTVISDYGTPVPMLGTSSFAWKSKVVCSVEAEVLVNGTNYTCTGWAGSGSIPTTGTTNAVTVKLEQLVSSIHWNWASDDTDQDGLIDEWELRYFGDLDQAYTNDFDADGQNDGSEYIAGTNPTNSASLFQLVAIIDGGHLILDWPTASNRIYNLYWTDNLQYTAFTNLVPNMLFPRHSITTTPVRLRGFYKMDVLLLP